MPEARVTGGAHNGHTYYECDSCNQWFETEKEPKEHGMKVHAPKIPAA